MALKTQQMPPTRKEYQAKRYDRLVGTRGFSEELLRTHFGLYEGYVTHTNKALDLLRQSALDAYAAAEVRRRLVWEFNGMRLHEMYFDGMASGGKELPNDGPLSQALAAEFGSMEEWWTRFQAVGGLRGSGWAVLVHDPVSDRLLHDWVSEHDRGAFAGTAPIVVLDLFEHAYMRDYGTDRKPYLQAFRDAIDWSACENRLKAARRTAPAPNPAAA